MYLLHLGCAQHVVASILIDDSNQIWVRVAVTSLHSCIKVQDGFQEDFQVGYNNALSVVDSLIILLLILRR